jgi:hypothetical protein
MERSLLRRDDNEIFIRKLNMSCYLLFIGPASEPFILLKLLSYKMITFCAERRAFSDAIFRKKEIQGALAKQNDQHFLPARQRH